MNKSNAIVSKFVNLHGMIQFLGKTFFKQHSLFDRIFNKVPISLFADSIQFPAYHMVPRGQYEIKVLASRTFRFSDPNIEDVYREAIATTVLDVKEGDPPQLSFQ